MEENLAARKYRQWICENSAELREFERKLQVAYNRQVLEAKLSYEKTEKMKAKFTIVEESQVQVENFIRHATDAGKKSGTTWHGVMRIGEKFLKIAENEIAEAERRQQSAEDERLKIEEEQKKCKEKAVADILQNQMMEKQKQLEYESALSALEQKLLYQELEDEKVREQELAEKHKSTKEKLRKEQMEFQELKLKIKEEDRLHKLAEEERFRNEATSLHNHDTAIIEARQKRIEAFEKIKQKIFDQLAELERLKMEQEEISQKLLYIEKEEQERKKAQEEEWAARKKKQMSVQNYHDLTIHKKLEKQRLKEEDKVYAENTRRNLEIAEDLEKQSEETRRKMRVTLRCENHNLIRYRRDLRTADLKSEIAAAHAEETARAEREKVVADERLRLLRSLDLDLLKHLPRGSLTEQDFLNLNSPRKE